MNKSIPTNGKPGEPQSVAETGEGKDFLTANLRLLENWYAAELERRLKDITEVLRSELQRQIDQMEARHKQRAVASHSTDPAEQPCSTGALDEEITRSEASLAECTAELEGLIGDDGSKLVNLLRARTQELELKAYIRGLKFRAGR